MSAYGDGTDVLDGYLQEALGRLGRPGFEAVVRAAEATCGLLADGQPAVLAGPDGAGFGPDLQREYLALLAVLITGRTDHHIVPLPGEDGTPGWAVVEPGLAKDPEVLQDLCGRIAATARENGRIGADLELAWKSS